MTEDIKNKVWKTPFFRNNKELTTFLLFLLFAVLLWLVNNLQRTIETEISIPIAYEALPDDIVISNELLESIDVTVRDKGQALYGYAFHRMFFRDDMTVHLDLMEWKHPGGIAHIPLNLLEGRVSGLMKPSTEILRISPDTLTVYYVEKDSKEVPVRLNSDISLSRQYILVGKPSLMPAKVMIYAPKDLLDKIGEVETELLEVEDLHDSATFLISIKAIDGVQFSHDEIEVSLKAEPFTETSVSVPVSGINIPKNCQIRTFPSIVNVTFLVRESEYANVDAEDFKAQIDMKESDSNTDNTLQKVVLVQCPSYAIRPQLSPDKVESLLEKKK